MAPWNDCGGCKKSLRISVQRIIAKGNTCIYNLLKTNLISFDWASALLSHQPVVETGATRINPFAAVAILLATSALYAATPSSVVKSMDDGPTFSPPIEVMTQVLGVSARRSGNIAVDARNGYVYTIFFDRTETRLYIAVRSTVAIRGRSR